MRSFPKKAFTAIAALFFIYGLFAQQKAKNRTPDFGAQRSHWVDSVYNTLSEDERIGQLFMVAAYSGGKNYNEDLITKLIAAHQVGGLIFMQGGPVRQAMLTNKYQHAAQVPLLLSMDGEWGLGMRLDSVKSFPRAMMLGAADDSMLVYRTGMAIGLQCKRMGVNMDFAPDVDVNNNPANPVINSRSFGEDKTRVARLGVAFMLGLQQMGVIACAKHFPGHGDTNVDSHKDLPLITKSLQQLDTLELYPFRRMIAAGVKSVMVAHLEVPALDTAAHVPTTLSRNTVTGLLQGQLGYKGLVVTDALGMAGVTKYFPAGDADLRAFAAGNDILLFSQDVPSALVKIRTALDSGRIPMSALESSVRKILGAKFDAGLNLWTDIDTTNLVDDLNKYVDPMRSQAAKAAITLVKDENLILKKLNENMRVGYVGINSDTSSLLHLALQYQFDIVDAHWLTRASTDEAARKLLDTVLKYDVVVVGVHNLGFSPGNNYGLSDAEIDFLGQVGCRNNAMIVLMGDAYAMQYCCGAGSVLVGYEDDSLTELATADVLLGKFRARGRLPVTSCLNGKSVCPAPVKPMPTREPTTVKESGNVLQRVLVPKEAGVNDMQALDRLDMFMARCIADGVFPGCRILAARDGKVFYDKAFGYLNYDKTRPVDTNTLYDMASCTKILATTLAVMRLYEQGKLDLDKTIGDYLPWTAGSNKAPLKVRDLLLHQAGLKAYIPFYKETLDKDGNLSPTYYRVKPRPAYSLPVAKDLYLRIDYPDTMWAEILAGPLDNKGKSVYSDLDYYFLYSIVQRITGETIDKYVEEQFYKPMGLTHILYNPLKRFDTTQIAPTEIDESFRNELVWGYVHDPGAAMLGGVGGHAGIFATAHDVGAIFQMLLNKGVYGKTRYFKSATVDLFTAYQSKLNHRGLGFDKPAIDSNDGGPAGARCSALAFGHQGFTGTCAWADPATGVVFVFLSNRVYPTASNVKINKLNVRTTAQDYIYEAFGFPVVHDRAKVWKEQTGK